MPMPDPTGDPGRDYGFFTPARITVLAVVALAAAIAAIVIAMKSMQRDHDKGDAKKGVGYHRITVSELYVATCRPGDAQHRSACVSCGHTGFHLCA